MRRFFLSVLLIPALCLPSFGQIREISDEESTSPAPSDSVLVIVDGFVSPVRFENNAVPPPELALHVCPFLSKEDIDTVRLIKAGETSSTIISWTESPPTRRRASPSDLFWTGNTSWRISIKNGAYGKSREGRLWSISTDCC